MPGAQRQPATVAGKGVVAVVAESYDNCMNGDRATPGSRQHRPRRRFGQHFLTDESILAGIADLVSPTPGDVVLEVGPGAGALTHHLLQTLERLVAVEIDRDLLAELTRRYDADPRLRLLEGDVLALDWRALLREEDMQRFIIVGNIPYNITAPLLFRLIAHFDIVSNAILTVQKEVAQRLASKPGSRDYGLLSVLLGTRAQVRLRMDVDRSRFRPAPRVDSAVIEIDIAPAPVVCIHDTRGFERLVRAAFSQRRKMLRNSLKVLLAGSGVPPHGIASEVAAGEWMQAAADRAGVDLSRRAETLSIQEFATLSNSLFPSAPAETEKAT